MLSILRGFLGLAAFLLLGDIVVRTFALPLSSGVACMLLLTSWLLLCRRPGHGLTAASQPVIGLWPAKLAPELDRFLADGGRALYRFAEAVHARQIALEAPL